MKKGKMKMCLDCLHCKVSAKATEKNRLYFCAETPKRERHREAYWLAKKVCAEFDDMRE